MNDIHNNLAPIAPVFFTIFDWIVFGVFLLGAGISVWFRWFRKKPIRETPKQKVVRKIFRAPRFSFDVEIKKLDEMRARGQWKDFALFASNLLKKILEQQYRMSLDFATGKEVEEILFKKSISNTEKERLREFFKLTDPIKFAQAQGRERVAQKIMDILKKFNRKGK